MCVKIITKRINIAANDFFTLSNIMMRGHKFKVIKNKRATKLVRCQSYGVRSINEWNTLLSHVNDSDAVGTFKARLDKH